MTGSPWSLVVPVLLAGLGFGVAWVLLWRRRASTKGRAGGRSRRDLELRLADLQTRQEDLYDQLRDANDHERGELELAAARNLKAIEEAGADLGLQPASDSGAGEPAVDGPGGREDAAAPVAARSSSAWLGFLGGVACAGLMAVLIFWAQRDARPREDDMAPAPPPSGEEHPMGPQLSAQDAAALEQFARRMEDDPTDVMARKQYAVGLLSTGQFFPAFEQAEILLASNDHDPDGLYVAAMVRMRMGQEPMARELFQRLLEDYPEHVPALTAFGVLELRASGLEAAEVLWDRALAASGGSNPEIERLIATAREQVAGPSGASQSGAGQPAGSPAPGQAPPTSPAPKADAYTIQIDLAPGAKITPDSVLFVSLRQGDVGPPAAARRIPRPRFPMTVSLSAADSMLGRPLPTDGSVWARLDADGSASTREEGEPFAEATLRIGEVASLTLQ